MTPADVSHIAFNIDGGTADQRSQVGALFTADAIDSGDAHGNNSSTTPEKIFSQNPESPIVRAVNVARLLIRRLREGTPQLGTGLIGLTAQDKLHLFEPHDLTVATLQAGIREMYSLHVLRAMTVSVMVAKSQALIAYSDQLQQQITSLADGYNNAGTRAHQVVVVNDGNRFLGTVPMRHEGYTTYYTDQQIGSTALDALELERLQHVTTIAQPLAAEADRLLLQEIIAYTSECIARNRPSSPLDHIEVSAPMRVDIQRILDRLPNADIGAALDEIQRTFESENITVSTGAFPGNSFSIYIKNLYARLVTRSAT